MIQLSSCQTFFAQARQHESGLGTHHPPKRLEEHNKIVVPHNTHTQHSTYNMRLTLIACRCVVMAITLCSTFSHTCSRTHSHSLPCSATPPRNANSANPGMLGSDLGYTISKISHCIIANCQRQHQLNCNRSSGELMMGHASPGQAHGCSLM